MLAFLRALFILLLPVLAFAAVLLLPVRELMGAENKGVLGIVVFLADLAALTVAETLLFRYWLLPRLGEAVGERVYGGSYVPEEDALVRLTARLHETRDRELLPELRALVLAQPRRVRGWTELARLYQDLFDDPAAARDTLLEGETHLRNKEERALLLVRAAQVCENGLHNPAAAQELYARAAERFPRTVYGKQAAERRGKM